MLADGQDLNTYSIPIYCTVDLCFMIIHTIHDALHVINVALLYVDARLSCMYRGIIIKIAIIK
jgi:hypothetical protein